MTISTLVLDPQFEVSQKIKNPIFETKLGDGYKQVSPQSFQPLEEYEVSRVGLTTTELQSILNSLKSYTGVESFQWRPNSNTPYKIYTCDKWETTLIAPNVWGIKGTFKLDQNGECAVLSQYLDVNEITTWLNGTLTFIINYTRNTLPFLINTSNIAVNSFHEVLGRSGYFPASAGTSEGQAILINACIQGFERTGVNSWLTRAQDLANAYVTNFFNTAIPSTPSNLWLPHWLVNVKSAFFTKGLATLPDYLNFGYFDVTVTFTNGIATIPSAGVTNGERLSNVYKVYTNSGELLWKNVYAPLISGSEYQIEYWVSNLMMSGSRFRIYPNSEGSNGTNPISTTEAAGLIKLTTNYTGTAKLVYSAYTISQIAVNQRFDAYPMWRSVGATEFNCAIDTLPWSFTAFKKLHSATANTSWLNAREAIRNNIINTATVTNISQYYRKESNTDVFSHPGSQVIVVNNSNGASSVRQTTGIFTNFLRVNVNAAPANTFPSVEFQNFAVQTAFSDTTQVNIETGHSNVTFMQIALSTSSSPTDNTQRYFCNFLIPTINTLVTRTFNARDFIKWDDRQIVWSPTIADIPIYTFSGSGGTATTVREETTISSQNAMIWRADINKGATGFAGVGYTIVDGSNIPLINGITRPPLLHWNITGASFILRITDASNVAWDRTITATSGWVKIRYNWSDFIFSTSNAGSGVGVVPDTNDFIRKIELHSITAALTTIRTFWLTQDSDPPTLPTPITVYKAALISRDKNAHTFYCGTFRPIGNSFDNLNYNPGVVPFTVNTIGGVIDAWRGAPMTGYQNPAIWRELGLENNCKQALQFLSDAQDAYTKQSVNKLVGAFAPSYLWAYWDAVDFGVNNINKFSWKAPDPNSSWCGYQYRALVSAAEAWMLDKSDSLTERVVSRFLIYLDRDFISRASKQPLTDFPEFANPFVGYPEPHASALIFRAALYANVAGFNREISFRLMKSCLDYLRTQYVTSGLMAGSFSNSQPNFTQNSATYKEYFGFWHGEIIISLCEYLRLKDDIKYPGCNVVFY